MTNLIDNPTPENISDFLSLCGNSLETFRYFNTREIGAALKKHIVTLILFHDDLPVGYAHLDDDGEKIWLGICIAENFRGMGFGQTLMTALAKHETQYPITLSVDESNHAAIRLYKKNGFVEQQTIVFREKSIILMEKTQKTHDTNIQTQH